MAEYPANSHRSKELATESHSEERKVQKVVSGKVTTKKNEVRKLTDIFISEDARNVKSYIFMDVLVPAIKKAISDIVTDGIDMIPDLQLQSIIMIMKWKDITCTK